jgi:hypothetical protein
MQLAISGYQALKNKDAALADPRLHGQGDPTCG